ncbi:MAG: hypothetical protein IJQ12_04490 [Lachnospiraceae bacterium]|nr:hypothetical protein [Lachnospiraceae bacterium]
MRDQTSGSALFLLEMIFVIFFFTLTAAICLRLFVSAHLTGKESTRLAEATEIAQNLAEEFRALRIDETSSFYYDEDLVLLADPEAEGAAYTAVIETGREDGLLSARIRVSDAGGEIYSLSLLRAVRKEDDR